MHNIETVLEALEAQSERCIDAERRLHQAEKSFEYFVSMAAHNLREPLRDVSSFSQLLAESPAVGADSEARTFLEKIQQGAAAMQSLLADVVEYCIASTNDRAPTRTEMEAVLRQSVLAAQKRIAERNAVVTHDPLPEVSGDFEMLARVLHHLIRNAVDYCSEPTPQVHISSRRADLDCILSVQDNGPGIAAEFRNRIFEPFQRLHGREQPGSGLGLAFCKRVIETHGGRIWVESTPGAGSTFFFSLPSAD